MLGKEPAKAKKHRVLFNRNVLDNRNNPLYLKTSNNSPPPVFLLSQSFSDPVETDIPGEKGAPKDEFR